MKLVLFLLSVAIAIQLVTCVCPSATKSDNVLKPSAVWHLEETGPANTVIVNSGSQGAAADGKFRSATPTFLEQTGNNHNCAVGKCYEFDLKASEGIEIKWIDGFSNSKSFSVAAWVYVTDASNGNHKSILTNRMHYGPTNRQAGFAFYIDQVNRPQVWLARYDAATGDHYWNVITSPTSCEQDRWNHVVFTYDFDTRIMALYLNGLNVKKLAHGAQYVYTPPPQVAGRDSMFIGTGGDAGIHFPFKGRIDEVRYYLYSLTAAQVTKLFDKNLAMLSTKPAIHLQFEDTPIAGNSLVNFGYVDIGNPTFGTSTMNSKSNCENNKCLEITGGTNNVKVPLKTGVTDTTTFSVIAWVRPTEIDRISTIFATFECCTDKKGIALRILANNAIGFELAKGGTSSLIRSFGAIPAKLNEWTHIALTYTSTVDNGEVKLYVNGFLVGLDANQAYVPPTVATGTIGSALDGSDPMKGDIDEFAYYTRVLSHAEIRGQIVWRALPNFSIGIRNLVAGSKFQFTVNFNAEVVSLPAANFVFTNQQDAIVESVSKKTDYQFTVVIAYPKKHAKKKRNIGPNIRIRIGSQSNVGPTCQMDISRSRSNSFSISHTPPAPHPTNNFDLYLAIMAAGGNGIEGAYIAGGYSVVDGTFSKQQINQRFSISQADCEQGSKQFKKVTTSVGDMVDGVGLIDGTALGVNTKLSSTDISYAFVDTKFASLDFCTTWNAVSTFNIGANGNTGSLLTSSGSVDYFDNEKYSMYMHPNKFITFNLDNIRKHHGVEISAIKADVGTSQSSCSGNAVGHNVLVDGVSKYYKEQKKSDVIQLLDIPITIDDKFLTIASHGVDNGDCLQSIFGNLRATSKACSAIPTPAVWNGTPPATFTFKGCYNIQKTAGMATVTGGTINSITSTSGTAPYHTWVVSVTPNTASKREVDMVGSVCMFGACATFGLLSASASGDPHFIGLNNKGFDVLPKHTGYYNLLATNNLQINSKFDFIQMVPNIRSAGTYITEIGIQIPNYNISVVSTESTDANVPSSSLTLNGKTYLGAITNSVNQPKSTLIDTPRVKAVWSHKNESNEEVQLSWKGRFVDEFTIEIDDTFRIVVLSAEDGFNSISKMWVSFPRRYLAIEFVVLDDARLASKQLNGIIGRTYKLPVEQTNNFNYSDFEISSLFT